MGVRAASLALALPRISALDMAAVLRWIAAMGMAGWRVDIGGGLGTIGGEPSFTLANLDRINCALAADTRGGDGGMN